MHTLKNKRDCLKIFNLYFNLYNFVTFNFGAKNNISMICKHALVICWFQFSSRDVATVLLPMQNWETFHKKIKDWNLFWKFLILFRQTTGPARLVFISILHEIKKLNGKFLSHLLVLLQSPQKYKLYILQKFILKLRKKRGRNV